MPVRSLNSAVFKWPDLASVDRAARQWAQKLAERHGEVNRVGYFGSYAAGNWSVGSDLDLIVVVESTELPFERRGLQFRTSSIPVPCDLLIYTESEWERLERKHSRFAAVLQKQTVWVYSRGSS